MVDGHLLILLAAILFTLVALDGAFRSKVFDDAAIGLALLCAGLYLVL